MIDTIILDKNGCPDTGWRCSVCFQIAQVEMAGEILCIDHAKRWKWGYGESFMDMLNKDGISHEKH